MPGASLKMGDGGSLVHHLVNNAGVVHARLLGPEQVSATEHFFGAWRMAPFLSVPLAILANMCSVQKVHRTARIALRTTPAQRQRCYGLLRSAGDVSAWVIDRNRQLREWHCPQLANFPALCRELTGTSFGELSLHAAEDVLKRYST